MIELICGPMYSGKSTALFQRLERLLLAKKHIELIRPEKDDRGYFTHSDSVDLNKLCEKFTNLSIVYVKEFTDDMLVTLKRSNFDAIFIDEYFMIPDIHKICFQNKFDVYFGGLLATSDCQLFPETIKILPYCDKIKKLNGVCMNCGNEVANYSFATFRKTEDVVVGDEKYKCLCQKCFTKAVLEKGSY